MKEEKYGTNRDAISGIYSKHSEIAPQNQRNDGKDRAIKEDCEEVFSDEETMKIMQYLIENFDAWNAGIILMFLTGIRVGELAALKPSDFESNTCVKIRRTEVRYKNDHGKYDYLIKESPKTAAGVRDVVISSADAGLVQKIRSLNPDGACGEYLFMRNGHRLKACSFRKRLRVICGKLNICPKSPHKVRKTYGTILLDNGVDKELVMQQMGHTSIGTTENHYHRNRRTLNEKGKIISMIRDFSAMVL